MTAQHTPGLIVPLTSAADCMRLCGRLSPARVEAERRVARAIRARECREVIWSEWPGSRRCLTECNGHEGWCEDCDAAWRVQMLNARINTRAAIAKATSA